MISFYLGITPLLHVRILAMEVLVSNILHIYVLISWTLLLSGHFQRRRVCNKYDNAAIPCLSIAEFTSIRTTPFSSDKHGNGNIWMR